MATNVLAIEFKLNSPETVVAGEEFTVTIDSDSQETYDIKIFVHKDLKEFSEIYIDKWRSPRNYIKEAYPSENEFTLKSNFKGETSICLRIRIPGKSNYDEVCNSITIEPPLSIREINNDQIEETTKELDSPQTPSAIEVSKNSSIPKNNKNNNIHQANQQMELEPILLKAPSTIKAFSSKQSKLRNFILPIFSLFLVIIVILLSFRKL